MPLLSCAGCLQMVHPQLWSSSTKKMMPIWSYLIKFSMQTHLIPTWEQVPCLLMPPKFSGWIMWCSPCSPTPSKSQCQGSQDKGCLAESLLQWVFRRLHLCEETTELDWCMMVYANPSTHANANVHTGIKIRACVCIYCYISYII